MHPFTILDNRHRNLKQEGFEVRNIGSVKHD